MRLLLSALLLVTALAQVGCDVRVEERRPLVNRDRDVDVKVDAPGVDVRVDGERRPLLDRDRDVDVKVNAPGVGVKVD